MSSHHVVRENQEPAVLMLSAENCNQDVLEQALEWSPLVIATSESAKYLIDKGIKVDVIFYNDTHKEAFIANQLDIETVSYSESVLKSALKFLRERNHNAVYVFTDLVEEVASALINTDDFSVNIFRITERWALVRGTISKWFPMNHQISVKGRNVKFYQDSRELMSEDLMPTKVSGSIKFSSEEPFWLIEILT